MLMPANGFNAF